MIQLNILKVYGNKRLPSLITIEIIENLFQVPTHREANISIKERCYSNKSRKVYARL